MALLSIHHHLILPLSHWTLVSFLPICPRPARLSSNLGCLKICGELDPAAAWLFIVSSFCLSVCPPLADIDSQPSIHLSINHSINQIHPSFSINQIVPFSNSASYPSSRAYKASLYLLSTDPVSCLAPGTISYRRFSCGALLIDCPKLLRLPSAPKHPKQPSSTPNIPKP